jgi:hypothetical protein
MSLLAQKLPKIESSLASATGLGSLPQLHGEGEEDDGVLTPSGIGRRGD